MSEQLAYVRDLLIRLASMPRVTGREVAFAPELSELIEPYCDVVRVDPWGNVEGIINPGGKPCIMVAAHVDQIGIIVKEITEEGYLKFEGVGWDPRVLYGSRVKLLTERGVVRGVIGPVPAHLLRTYKELEEKKIEIRDLAIDVGASNKEEAENMGIKPGTYGVADYEPIPIGSEFLSSPGLDNAAGTASMIYSMKLCSENKDSLNAEIHFTATVQEEIGLRGAEMMAYKLKPEVAIAVDVTFAKQPLIPEEFKLSLGKGPVISKGPIYHPEIVELIERAAEDNKIPHQYETDFRGAGTDTWVIQVARGGVKT
ncbi:MAG: M28 family peptidase, partial [Candidatus Korarchaeum sp.]|nr:M28 family peptidase [Candidatus Korarchaeum sp.]MDW8035893.1 M28 family peptidase [Candidatus Korarchaeum sp.]